MAPLMRKRDKKKEKARAEALTKKRKELYVEVVIGNEGKRGKGRRQRVSRIQNSYTRAYMLMLCDPIAKKDCGAEEERDRKGKAGS